MGFCFSYCRRRRSTDDDHEPLLPQAASSGDIPPPQSYLDKAADVFAALRVGKLPSQDQINAALRKVLHSQVLTVEDNKSVRVLGRKQQYGPLSEKGKIMLNDIRELVEAIIQFGMEKNDDDSVQDLIYQNTQLGGTPFSVDVEAAKGTKAAEQIHVLGNAIPSFDELDSDAHRLSDALFTLSRILLTSSSFRVLLSDILLMSRALLADAAADVGHVAHKVGIEAKAVEQAVRPGDTETESPDNNLEEAKKQVQDGLRNIGKEAKKNWDSLEADASGHLKESVADRLQKVLAQAQKDPAYKSALHTLIYLFSKYIERVNTAVSAASSLQASTSTVPTPIIATESHFKRALTDLRILLERLASGRSLSPLILHVDRALRDITNASSSEFKDNLRRFFEDVRSGIERALGEPGFATSSDGHRFAEQLYERGQTLMRSNALWSAEANKALDEADAFVHALVSDRTTRRLFDALDKISSDAADLFHVTAGVAISRQRAWGEELKSDLIGWVMPRALGMLKALPMPRVEWKSETLEVVVDALVLYTTASFLPDHVLVQNWNEVRMEASAASMESPYANGKGVQAAARTRVHIDGLRISANCIGYYLQYKGLLCGLLSWEDNGLLNVDVGSPGVEGEGLSADIELETSLEGENTDQIPMFRVNDVNVDLPGLHVWIGKSKHWILNKLLLQPLAGPITRRVLRRILALQIRAALENVAEKLSEVKLEAKRRADSRPPTDETVSMKDYWEAICVTVGPRSADEEPEDHESSFVETDTQVTLRGVVRSTRTQMNPESASPPTPTETLVAVGIGPQILPGKGGPERGVYPVTEQAKGARAEVEEAAENVAGKAKAVADDALEAAAAARDNLEDASARMKEREDVEVKRKGWKSPAFDL